MSASATTRLIGANLRARIAALAALSLTAFVVARTADASGIGAFTLLRVLPWLTGLVLSNGIYAAAPFFLSGPHREDRRFRSTLPAMALAAGIVGGACWAGASPVIAPLLFKGIPTSLVAAAGISVLTQLVETTGKACSQGCGDLTGSNRVILLEELVFLPWYGVLLGSGVGTYTAIVFALPLGDLTTSSLAWGRLTRHGYFAGAGRPSFALARQVSHYGLRAEVGSIMQTLNARLDFVIVSALLGTKAVGIYAIASRYAELLRLPSLAMNYVLFPAYAKAGHAKAYRDARIAVGRTWWTSAAAAVPMAALAPFVLPFVYGNDFRASTRPALVLLIGLTGVMVNGIVTAYLSGIGRPGIGSLAIGGGLVATVVLDLLLIPRLGVIGAATASSVTYLTTTIILVVAFHRVRPIADRRSVTSTPSLPAEVS